MRKSLFLFVMLFGSVYTTALSQILTPKDNFILNFDYARFNNNKESSYLEFYYDFYPRFLSYSTEGGKLTGAVQINTTLTNKATNQAVVHQQSYVPVTVADTSSPVLSSSVVTQLGYAVPFGEYSLFVEAYDSLAPSRRDSLRLTILVHPPATGLAASDVELCSNIRQSADKESRFYKNSFEVVPNPTLVFGSTSYPVTYYYLELYNLNSDPQCNLTTQIVGQDGKVVKTSTQKKSYKVNSAVEVGTMNVTTIPSGKYLFRVLLADGKGQAIAHVDKPFFVHNPQIKGTELSPVAMSASALIGLSGPELADEFRKAQYIETPDEIKTFANITSDQGRREFLARMWTEVEAGRGGRPPITRQEYFRRIAIADQRYHAMSKEGWRTDRGRVYILYSDPDEIERVPSGEQSKPYQIWHYNSIENGVIFVFADLAGYGDYILLHSTKRGEVSDENWEAQTR